MGNIGKSLPYCSIKNLPILNSEMDLYKTVHIKSTEYPLIRESFAKNVLEKSMQTWKQADCHAIWFEIHIQDSWWVPILSEKGFALHHTNKEHIMMTKWLLERVNTLPKYPFTSLGAGGLVVNNNEKILLMREQKGRYLGWKFPGGSVDPEEKLHDAAIREVFEETGIKTEKIALFGFRHSLKHHPQYTGNIYFLFVLKPLDEFNNQIKLCSHEAADCKWMSRDEIKSLTDKESSPFLHYVLNKYDEWKKLEKRGGYYENNFYFFH